MTRWAVWSDADGFVTDPMDDYAEAQAALESMVTPEQILVLLPICQHWRVETECERCKA